MQIEEPGMRQYAGGVDRWEDRVDRDPDRKIAKPTSNRAQVNRLVARLHQAQQETARQVQQVASFEHLGDATPDGFTVNDTLRMWVWHFWTHHRDLVRIRGPLSDDDPHFHVPHYVRDAYEEFGKFVGELACLSDEYLDVQPPGGGRTVRETVEHVIGVLETYVYDQIERATPRQEQDS